MVFKFVVFCTALAAANAGLLGAPATIQYSSAPAVSHSYISQPLAAVHAAPAVAAVHAAPVAVHAPAIGASQQSVIRSLGGNQAISTYSKAVDSAFSTVRKYDTRITNDALSVAHAPVAYAAHAAPVAYAAHAAPVAYAAHAAPVAYAAHAAPVAYAAHAAPVAYASPVGHATYAAAAPVISKAAISYSPAAVVAHTTFEGLGAHYEW